MVNILLCCSAGMSTSLMVSKMQASAEERGIETRTFSFGYSSSLGVKSQVG